jgi:hypothetical protein
MASLSDSPAARHLYAPSRKKRGGRPSDCCRAAAACHQASWARPWRLKSVWACLGEPQGLPGASAGCWISWVARCTSGAGMCTSGRQMWARCGRAPTSVVSTHILTQHRPHVGHSRPHPLLRCGLESPIWAHMPRCGLRCSASSL